MHFGLAIGSFNCEVDIGETLSILTTWKESQKFQKISKVRHALVTDLLDPFATYPLIPKVKKPISHL